MKDPWKVSEKDYPSDATLPKKIKFLLSYAILAPSSHNTQPWDFSIDGSKLNVNADFNRRLLVGDPTDRELYISIGHAISHFLIAAERFGLTTNLDIHPKKNKKHVATISVSEKNGNKNENVDLFKAITTRMTNRSLYKKDKKLPKNFSKNASKKLYDDILLKVVENKELMQKVAVLTQKGIKEAFENPDFRNEVALWIRHNWTEQKDGMPGYTLGIPDAMSIMAPAAIRATSMAKQTSLEEKKMILSASGVGVLLANHDNIEDWIKVGISSSNVWLYAETQGLSMAILSAAVEMPEQRKELKKLLSTDKFPCLFFRLGYPTKKMKHSPRRTVADVLKP